MNENPIHERGDGRGLRKVLVDGRELPACFYADTRRGVAKAYRLPYKVDKYRKRLITKTLRGKVTVESLEPEQEQTP